MKKNEIKEIKEDFDDCMQFAIAEILSVYENFVEMDNIEDKSEEIRLLENFAHQVRIIRITTEALIVKNEHLLKQL